jgi:hypothetical protein
MASTARARSGKLRRSRRVSAPVQPVTPPPHAPARQVDPAAGLSGNNSKAAFFTSDEYFKDCDTLAGMGQTEA